MPRYIDADKLSKEVLASWDKDNHRTLEASQVHRQEHCHLMRIIEKQPIADVVPKSEVERLRNHVNRLKKYNEERNIKLHARLVAETTKKVVREIFEEIEELDIQLNNGDLDIKYFGSAIAKLKKKFTESEGKE